MFNSVTTLAITLDDMIKEADRIQNLGDFEKALSLFKQAETECRNSIGEYNSTMLYIYGSEAACAQQLDNYIFFVESLIKVDKVGTLVGYDSELNEAFLCFEIAKFYLNTGETAYDVAKAMPYIERGTKRSQLESDNQMLNLWEYISVRAKYIMASYDTNLSSATEPLYDSFSYFINQKYVDKNDAAEDIIDCGLVLSANLMDRTQNQECIEIINKIEANVTGIISHPRYLEVQCGKLYALANLSKSEECFVLGESLINSFSETSENYQLISAVKYNLGRAYLQKKEYLKALTYLKGIYESPYSEQLRGINTDYILSEIACCYLNLENYEKAKDICIDILNRNPTGSTLLEVAWVMGALENIVGDNLELSYIEDFVRAYDTLGYEDLSWAESFLTFAKRYADFFQYSKSLQLADRAIAMYEKIGNYYDLNYYFSLLRKASVCARLEDFEGFTKSLNSLNEHKSVWMSILLEDIKGKDYENVSSFIECLFEPIYMSFALTNYFFRQGVKNNEINEDQKIIVYDGLTNVQSQLLELANIDDDLTSWLQNNNPNRLGILYDYIALTYRDLNEFDKEIECIDRGLQLLNDNCEMYGVLSELKNLAIVQSSNFNIMHDFLNEKFQSDKEYLKGLVNSFSKESRAEMWNTYYYNISNYIEYAIKGKLGWLNELAYNSILLSKGLLLQSDVDFISRVQDSNDVELVKKYNAYVKYYQNNELAEAKKIEHEILRTLNNEYESDLFKNDWKDVRNSLKDDDYAIEFKGYNDYGDIRYFAFLINKKSENPTLVEICSENELNECMIGTSYDFDKLSNIIWTKFYDIIPSKANVYFSPDLQLHSIPLEHLPISRMSNEFVSDYWNLYRLSSTRELIGRGGESINPDNLAIFGGFEYSVGVNKLMSDFEKLKVTTRTIDVVDLDAVRGVITTVMDLPGSKSEVKIISDILYQNNIGHTNFIGNNGTESAFKAYASKGNVIHISTHGYYYTPEEMQRGNKISRILSKSINIDNQHDKILYNSGLMMAGVNDILQGKLSPSLCDDGILTSREISQLDLSSTKFAILSACETGIGKVTGDGIFGLQRGWKMAGVKTIMMSLWKVDDKATEYLMIEFYKNWTSGLNIHDALKLAQKSVRYTPGWEAPQFWAGFILLDCV